MENPQRKQTSSGEKFSFPATIGEYSDQFEFGCVTTPDSPNSPADHLFFNGRLLPHVFPINQTRLSNNFSYSRSTSRTSSISSSRDSLMSSRSNSTNSRSSNCSSARTSTSEASDQRNGNNININPGRTSVSKERSKYYQCYPSSQRWQLIAAVPVLVHQGSRSRRVVDQIQGHVLERKGLKKTRGGGEADSRLGKSWFGKRILKSFISACKECHAIETSNVDSVVI